MTILEIGTERLRPLLFVTGEEKADWQHRSGHRGELPRCELVDEFRRKSSGKPFYIASFSRFLELYGAPTEVVSEVREQEQSVEAQARSESRASISVNLVEEIDLLMELAVSDPRTAIKGSWERLARAIFRAARVPTEDTLPYTEVMSLALRRLEVDTRFSAELVPSIKELHETARKVFYQSPFAYDPTKADAESFVLASVVARKDLGEQIR